MAVFEKIEEDLRAQILNSRDREQSEIDQQSEVVDDYTWTEGYYEGYRSGIEYALSRILFHKTQQQIME